VKIHLLATEPHYLRHTRAVWKHLPDDVRGEAFTGRAAAIRSKPGTDYVMVGGFIDIDRVQRHRLIYVEHGAGQTYLGEGWNRYSEAYAHAYSRHPERVVAYVCPRQAIADAWGRPAFAAGCPAIDGLFQARSWTPRAYITFHWDARQIAPEARSARPHWIENLHEMVARLRNFEFDVIGHGHPRDREAQLIWRNLGVPFEPDPDRVLCDAALLVADNTSLMYEAAALHIPVIALNAPWYRRHVHHGLRFWDHVPGPQINDIDAFLKLPIDSYAQEGSFALMRHDAVIAAYDGFPDGKAGQRAARWLVDTLVK
jgi:hypothetical protein